MKFSKLNSYVFLLSVSLFLILSLQGCSFIGGIFKAGVEVGIFLVIVLIIVILILMNRFKKR